MFFERAFDLVHMITISIRHLSNYSIIAGRRVTENYIGDAGNYLSDVELVHRLIPRVRRFTASQRCARTATKRRKELAFSPAHRRSQASPSAGWVLLYGFPSPEECPL